MHDRFQFRRLFGRDLDRLLTTLDSPRELKFTYVSKDAPPFLIMHGDQDHTVPFRQSESFYAALKKSGVDATLVPMKGAGHGFAGPEAIGPVRDFLKRCFLAHPLRAIAERVKETRLTRPAPRPSTRMA